MESVPRRRQARSRRIGVDVSGALNLVGWVVKYLALGFLVPAAVALGYGEPVWPFLAAAAITFAAGLACERLTGGREHIGSREGYLVVALIWLLVAVFGALPYAFGEPQLSRPLDAFFESMSGFSTTGASVLRDVEALPRSIAMWRQLTAWFGGVGIIILFLAVFPRLRIGGRQALFRHESAGPDIDVVRTIRETASRFVALYVGITVAATVVLAALGWSGLDPRMDLFRAVAHAFAVVSTAGFSTEARSIEAFAPVTQWALAFFMLLGGTNFALMFAVAARRTLRPLARDDEFRVYVAILFAAGALIAVELIGTGLYAGEEAIRHATIGVLSMMTTTGFASADFSRWTPLTSTVLFGLVLIGGSAGSTSGSIKLVRHIAIARMLRRELDQTLHPHRVAPLRINGAVVDEKALRAMIVFVFLYVGMLAVGTLIVLMDASFRDLPVSAFDGFAASAAALGGTGSGAGFAGPMGNFAPFTDLSSGVLTALMYLGRLELIPVLVLFTRSHWRA